MKTDFDISLINEDILDIYVIPSTEVMNYHDRRLNEVVRRCESTTDD